MRHLWKKPLNIKSLSPVRVCKTPESNMSLVKEKQLLWSDSTVTGVVPVLLRFGRTPVLRKGRFPEPQVQC
jgi:hypothetical protein